MRAKVLAVTLIKLMAGCFVILASLNINANEADRILSQLSDEQSRLLYGTHLPIYSSFNTHSLSSDPSGAVSLVSFQITAETNLMQGAALQLGAQYRSWAVEPKLSGITYNTYSTEFTLKAPIQHALDFSDSIRETSELCPEKLIDKMVIDGAVSLNFSW